MGVQVAGMLLVVVELVDVELVDVELVDVELVDVELVDVELVDVEEVVEVVTVVLGVGWQEPMGEFGVSIHQSEYYLLSCDTSWEHSSPPFARGP